MGFSRIFLIFLIVSSIYAIPINLEGSNDVTPSKAKEIKQKEAQVSNLCINRKDVLGDGEIRDNDAIDCIPLTGHDKEIVLNVKNDLASLLAIEDEANGAKINKKSILTELNEFQGKKPLIKEHGLKLEEEEFNEVNPDHSVFFTEDLFEGSGQMIEELGREKGLTMSVTEISPNFLDELDSNITLIEQRSPIFPNSKESAQAAAAKQIPFSVGGFSSVFAGWAAGFFGTFTLMAIGAMCAKNRQRKAKKRQKIVKLNNGISEKYESIEMT